MSKYKNIAQIKAIEKKNRERLLKVNPNLNDRSGIYFLTRTDENDISYFYIGQAVNIIQRMCGHLTGYQHIDLSIKKRGFSSEENPYGWKLNFINYPKSELDKMEQYWILEYTKKGYQCRYNKTAGGQGEGKEKIARELSSIAEKHLKIEIREDKKNNKISQRQYEKFMDLLKVGDSE